MKNADAFKLFNAKEIAKALYMKRCNFCIYNDPNNKCYENLDADCLPGIEAWLNQEVYDWLNKEED